MQSEVADGIPYECPNFFPLDGRMVLLYSPYGPVEVLVGDLDEELNFHVASKEVLDPAGRQGFYAPQVFRDEAGRTILQGWMPEADGDDRARERGYSGAMNLPRILSIRGDYVHAEPMASVWSMMQEKQAVEGRHFLAQICCKASALPLRMELLASPDGREKTLLTLAADGILTLDRSISSLDEAADKSEISRKIRMNEDVQLLLAVDGSALECCVNGQWLSGRVYPTDPKAGGLKISAGGEADIRLGEYQP